MDTIYTPTLLTREEYVRQNSNTTIPFISRTPAIGNIIKACLSSGQVFWAIIEDRIYRATNESTAYIARIDTHLSSAGCEKISYGTRVYINPVNVIDIA